MKRPITPAHTCAPAEENSEEARGFDVVVHDGPLPPLGQGELSPAEVAFRDALDASGSATSRFARWAQKTRTDWMSARGLVKA